jgi:hypothetical protein
MAKTTVVEKKVVPKEVFRISGISLPIPAKVAADSLMKVYQKNNNELTPELVVKAAKSETNPLHKCFEWDDKKAGIAYRLKQAGNIIRCVVVTKQDTKGNDINVRAFVSIRENEKGIPTINPFMPAKSYYVSVEDAMTSKDLRKYTVDVALFDLKNWMAKYESLKELDELFSYVEQYLEKKK